MPKQAAVIPVMPNVTTQIKTQPLPVVRTAVKIAPPPAIDMKKPFTIVAVTMTRKDSAIQEMDKLRRQGFSPVLMQSNRYYQVCIGAYADKSGKQIQQDLKKVRRLYKDAYLKSR
jgi:hypothetical protein